MSVLFCSAPTSTPPPPPSRPSGHPYPPQLTRMQASRWQRRSHHRQESGQALNATTPSRHVKQPNPQAPFLFSHFSVDLLSRLIVSGSDKLDILLAIATRTLAE